MDWSLVLLSQGIESIVQRGAEGWQLVVAADARDRAAEALRLYEAENRAWPWRQEMFGSGVLFDWASLAWAVVVVACYGLSGQAGGLREAGLLDGQAVRQGEWWRVCTAMWLHRDAAHLAMNLAIGLPLVGLAMGSCGSGTGFLAAWLAGVGGNVASLLLLPAPHRSLGASGLILGALGLLAAQWLSVRQHTPGARRLAVGGLMGGGMLFVLLGLTPGTNVVAHVGGFATGLLLGAALSQNLTLAKQPHVNLLAALWCAALVVGTWWLALP